MGAISNTRLSDLYKLIEEGKEALFYSWPEWEKTRRCVLALDRWECTRCKAMGKYSPAAIVHHVAHLKDKPELALSVFNPDTKERQLVSLCRACHEAMHPERLRPAWQPSAVEPLTTERWD